MLDEHLHRRAPSGRERDVTPGDPLRFGPRALELAARQDLAQRHAHLELRERGTETTAHATTEGDPGVGIRLAVDETLGSENVRIRVKVGSSVCEPYRGRDVRPRGKRVTIDPQLRAQAPARERYDGPQTERLRDHRPQVVILALRELALQALQRVRVTQEQVERP